MSRFINRKRAAVVGLVASVAVAGAAFAYFTSSGTGSGTAKVGKSTAFVIAETPFTATPLYPDPAGAGTVGNGANVETHPFTVTNPSAGQQQLTTFKVSVANTDGSVWTVKDASNNVICSASDFSVGGEKVGAAHEIGSLEGNYGASAQKTANVTLEMIDSGSSQNGCQGVTVPLYYSAS